MKKKVLIVDDDFYFSGSLQWYFKNNGFEVVEAKSGEEGLQKMKTDKPDAVLLDCHMPEKDGFVVLLEKQSDKSIAGIPVIMMSDSADPQQIEKALELGARDYAIKSNLSQEEMVEKVREQLEIVVAEESLDKEGATGTGSLSDRTILWVEDDPGLSDSIAQVLAKEKCKFLYASNADKALEIMTSEIPDVVILDILLPGKNGFDIAEQMRSDPRLAAVTIIFVTNYGQKEYRERAALLGAASFIVKLSMTLEELVGEIKRVLQRQESLA